MALFEVATGIVVAQCLDYAVTRVDAKYIASVRQRKELERSLNKSISSAFEWFQTENPNLSNSLFDKHFVNTHLKDEIAKLLTRTEFPDAESTAERLQQQLPAASIEDFIGPAKELFLRIETEMGEHESLRNVLNSRQIEQIREDVRGIRSSVASRSRELTEEDLHRALDEQHERLAATFTDMLRRQDTVLGEKFKDTQTTPDKLGAGDIVPDSDSNPLHRVLNKSIDTARDLLKKGRYGDAQIQLASIENEAEEVGGYTWFRHQTCVASCELAAGNSPLAAEMLINAFALAKDTDKAWSNRVHGLIILDDLENAQRVAQEAVDKFPESENVWALKVAVESRLQNLLSLDDIPEGVRDSSTVLHTLAYARLEHGKLNDAFAAADRSYDLAPSGLETLNLILVPALSMALEDALPPPLHEPSEEGREALNKASIALEAAMPVLERADATDLVESIMNNGAVLYDLLGDREHAFAMAEKGVARGFFSDGIVRLIVENYEHEHGSRASAEFLKDKYASISTSMLLGLLETAARLRDEAWIDAIRQALSDREMSDEFQRDLEAIEIVVTRSLKGVQAAIESAEAMLQRRPESVSLRLLLANLKKEHGDIADEDLEILSQLSESATITQRTQIAEIMCDLGWFEEAARHYETLVKEGDSGYIAQKYVFCLLKTHARGRASKVLSMIPESRRQYLQIRKLEMMLYEQTGQKPELLEVLRDVVERYPNNAFFTDKLLGYLRLDNKEEEFRRILESDPVFTDEEVQCEVRFALLQRDCGFVLPALKRIYRLFRNAPSSKELAGWVWTFSVELKKVDMDALAVETVAPGAAVHASNDTNRYTFLIDLEDDGRSPPWGDLFSPESSFSKSIMGKRVGDRFKYNGVELTITGLSNLFFSALEKANAIIRDTPGWTGPVLSISNDDNDAAKSVETVLAISQKRNAGIREICNKYLTSCVPIPILASFLQRSDVEIFFDWPREYVRKLVSDGGIDDLTQQKKVIEEDVGLFTADVQALLEIYFRGVWPQVLEVLGPLMIPQSLVDHLKESLLYFKNNPYLVTRSPMEWANGQFVPEKPTLSIPKRVEILEGLILEIEKSCEVVPVQGPDSPMPNSDLIARVLDKRSMDLMLLSRERGAHILSEDSNFRTLAAESGIHTFLRLQPVLDLLVQLEKLDHPQYSKIVLTKAAEGDTFIHLSPADLCIGALESKSCVPPLMHAVIGSFAETPVAPNSALSVSTRFLMALVQTLDAPVVIAYFKLLRDTLCKVCPDDKSNVEWTLFYGLLEALRVFKLPRKKMRRYEVGLRGLEPVGPPPAAKPTYSRSKLFIATRSASRQIINGQWP